MKLNHRHDKMYALMPRACKLHASQPPCIHAKAAQKPKSPKEKVPKHRLKVMVAMYVCMLS